MRTEVTMPRMGQGMEDGVILSWRANVGDVVKRGDPLLEIESDKATVEIEAFARGRLAEIVVPAGGKALIGAVLGYIEAESVAPSPALNTDFVGTRNGVSVDKTTNVEAEQSPTPTLPQGGREIVTAARMSPLARRMAANHGLDPNAVQGSGPGGRILKGDVAAHMSASAAGVSVAPSAAGGGLGRGRLDVSPVARRLAGEYGVDLYTLVGSAPNGRIIRRDVEAARVAPAEEEYLAGEAGGFARKPSVPTPMLEDDASVEIRTNGQAAQEQRLPLSRLRRIAAGRMVESKTTIPHFYLTMDVDMAQPLRLRESLKRRGRAVSINDLVLKAAALALAEYPTLNATVDGNDLILHPHINMAVAVAVGTKEHPEGLITPVIHECERLSLTQISEAAAALAGRAREGKLRPDDLAGATFTVSNLGMFGIRQFEAIINPPQVVILAVGAMQAVPVFDEADRVVRSQRLTVTLSADHRATDGAEAAGFLQAFKTALEDGFMLAE